MTKKKTETLYRVDVVDKGTQTVSGKSWRGLSLAAAEQIASFGPYMFDKSSGKSVPIAHEGQELIIREDI
jgi:hypothetical protein